MSTDPILVTPALGRRREIPRVELQHEDDFLSRVAASRQPAIVTGLMRQWPAFAKWSPAWFKDTYPDARFLTSVNLPTSGVSYDHDWKDHQQDMPMATFIDGLADFSKPAYVRRQVVERFPGAARDVRFRELVGSQGHSTEMFLWIGTANTRTGLHFDLQDGVLAQFHGRKSLMLVDPEASKYLYPYPDSITKSRVTADAPDLERFPLFREAEIWEGVLSPGEFVFLPQRWWHAITAMDVSISSSFNWGDKISWRDVASSISAGGARHWAQVSRDFVVHGLFKRPYRERMFDDPPFGKLMFDAVDSGVRRRLQQR